MYSEGTGHTNLTYRSGEGEVVLLFVTVAGFTLAVDLIFELLFEFFLLASCCLAALI